MAPSCLRGDFSLQVYTYTDRAGDVDSRWSKSDYDFFAYMDGSDRGERSSKRVSLQLREADYMAILENTQEAVILKVFLCNIDDLACGSDS